MQRSGNVIIELKRCPDKTRSLFEKPVPVVRSIPLVLTPTAPTTKPKSWIPASARATLAAVTPAAPQPSSKESASKMVM